MPTCTNLLHHRRKKDYKAVLRAVQELCPGLAPQEVVADFELAVWKAMVKVFPETVVRWLQLPLQPGAPTSRRWAGTAACLPYTGRSTGIYKATFALPYLPKEHIRSAFNRITSAATEQLQPLVDYVRRQWLTTFVPKDWCVYRQNVRTNNHVKGWHNRLNTRARTANLSFYMLVSLLKSEAELVPLQCQLLNENKLRKWQKRWQPAQKDDCGNFGNSTARGTLQPPTSSRPFPTSPHQPKSSDPSPPPPFPGSTGSRLRFPTTAPTHHRLSRDLRVPG